MAKIHGISGSTRYLLNGTRPIGGRKLTTLDEIAYFQKNYEMILAERAATIGSQQDDLIASLSKNEVSLDQKIKGDIAKRTTEVYTHILDINTKIESTGSFFPRSAYIVQFWMANFLSSPRIHFPSYGTKLELKIVQYRKTKTITNKPETVRKSCWDIIQTQAFLKANSSFLAGAYGEEEVIRVLSRLSDDYHVLNDVNLNFEKSIYWKEHREYIKTCQIDHIVVGPTGLFLLETKNWTRSNMQNKSYDLIHQVNRANLALWYHLKDNYWRNETPKIRKVVVSVHGFAHGQKSDPFIEAVTPDRLCDLITSEYRILSEDAIHKLIRSIPCREAN